MLKPLRTLIALLSIASGAFAGPPSNEITLEIGFDFDVGAKRMSPGRYRIRSLSSAAVQLCRDGDPCRTVPSGVVAVNWSGSAGDASRALFWKHESGRISLWRIVLPPRPKG